MGFIGGKLGYWLLSTGWQQQSSESDDGRQSGDKLEHIFGPEIYLEMRDKVVIDFGCGGGREAVEIARKGAKKVIGIDIRDDQLEIAAQYAMRSGVASQCEFLHASDQKADIVISIDAFEHFADPIAMLLIMKKVLKPGGYIIVSFGPTWYHPYGGHLFSVFPWAHLIFTEAALIRWRSDIRSDGASTFAEVAGGLNQITIRQFENIVEQVGCDFLSFEAVPIRSLRAFANRLTREFTTSLIRCRLQCHS